MVLEVAKGRQLASIAAIAVSAPAGSAFLSLLRILSFWKRPG
jgi:hypothetical protein